MKLLSGLKGEGWSGLHAIWLLIEILIRNLVMILVAIQIVILIMILIMILIEILIQLAQFTTPFLYWNCFQG